MRKHPSSRREETPPAVSKMTVDIETKIPRAMKEFWVVQELFKACNKFEIGGLQKVDFAGRLTVDKNPLPFRSYVEATVVIELPFSKLENFMSELYASTRVPFVLKEMTLTKTPEILGKHLSMETSVEFKDPRQSQTQDYDALIPEPNMVATMTLRALEWRGVPEEKPTQSK